MIFIKTLRDALEWRAQHMAGAPQSNDTIWRAFAGKPDGCNGVIIDVLGSYVWIRIFDSAAAARVDEIVSAVGMQFGDAFIYCSHRTRPDSAGSDDEARFVWKFPAVTPPARLAKEQYKKRELIQTMNFEIRPAPDHDFGIYADGRAARQWLGLNAHGCSLLNLFAYTCGFGIAALTGGASKVTNVDYSKEYLSWGMDNARLNGATFAVVPEDCLKYLRRLQSRITKGAAERPDIIVLDPPAFLIGRGSARLNRNVFPEMFALCLAILSSNGKMLVSCNDRYLNVSESGPFIELLNKIAASGGLKLALKKVQQSVDVVGMNAGESDSFYLPAQFWEISLIK